MLIMKYARHFNSRYLGFDLVTMMRHEKQVQNGSDLALKKRTLQYLKQRCQKTA